ncbi:protein of unknown function [Nitrospira japonica]|uniref:Uncharacterized protein n=1 Tax=Nitrospira japonica TaxID=1325564 RepID=A0A1W1I9E0_9BACT|nr:protein of unknown function [Nitrospira japonica]
MAFSIDKMPEHEDRLPFAFDAEITQRALIGGRAGKLTARTGADSGHGKDEKKNNCLACTIGVKMASSEDPPVRRSRHARYDHL